MTLTIGPETQRLLDERMKAGRYASLEELLIAALTSLEQNEEAGAFDNGEWDALLEAGEQSISAEGTLDGDEAYRARQRDRARTR